MDASPSLGRIWPPRIAAALTLLTGLIVILEVLVVRLPGPLELLIPFDFEFVGRNLGLLAGMTLVYVSGRLAARKRVAWRLAVVASTLVVIGHLLFSRQLSAVLIPSVSLLVLLWFNDSFDVLSEPISLSQGVSLFALSVGLTLVYGTFGFYVLLRRDFGHDFSLVDSMVRTLREFSLAGNNDLVPRTHQARWFLNSLDAFGTITAGFAIWSLFRPLSYRYGTQPAERALAREIITRYGNSSEDQFKLWPEDKAYFFGSETGGVIAYHVSGGVAVALGGPVGPPDRLPDLIRQFRYYCHRHDWTVTFVYLTPDQLGLLEAQGWRSFMIGQDAIIETAKFATKTGRNKHFRAVRNKFNRLGYRFEVVEPPHGERLLRQLRQVTRAWLALPGRVERGFALGYHDRTYLQRSPLYLLWGPSGQLEAFVNGVTSYNPRQASIDLLRHRPGGETGTMDYLLTCVIEHLAASGQAELSLGLAPLSGLGEGSQRDLPERLAGRLSRLDIAGFAFSGLRRFKDKFEPRWEDRYLAYERGPANLSRSVLAIMQSTRHRILDK